MSVFPDWQKFAVVQRNPHTGCIPTAFEMALRARGVEGINFETFQEDFDFGNSNNLALVAHAVRKRYPFVDFQSVEFKTGVEKLRFVEKRLSQKEITIVSLANSPNGQAGWHIMPIVDAEQESLFLLNRKNPNGRHQVIQIQKCDFVRVHDEWDGGKDISYLAEPLNQEAKGK